MVQPKRRRADAGDTATAGSTPDLPLNATAATERDNETGRGPPVLPSPAPERLRSEPQQTSATRPRHRSATPEMVYATQVTLAGPSPVVPLPPALDLSQLRRYTLGNVELEMEILDLYAEEAPRMLKALLDAPTAKARHDAAHALKGSSASVGAWRVAAAAARIEADPPPNTSNDAAPSKNFDWRQVGGGGTDADICLAVDQTLTFLKTLQRSLADSQHA
jgi:HPt (histidine-containing phosphotransfer) domain-containing protein